MKITNNDIKFFSFSSLILVPELRAFESQMFLYWSGFWFVLFAGVHLQVDFPSTDLFSSFLSKISAFLSLVLFAFPITLALPVLHTASWTFCPFNSAFPVLVRLLLPQYPPSPSWWNELFAYLASFHPSFSIFSLQVGLPYASKEHIFCLPGTFLFTFFLCEFQFS